MISIGSLGLFPVRRARIVTPAEFTSLWRVPVRSNNCSGESYSGNNSSSLHKNAGQAYVAVDKASGLVDKSGCHPI